MANDDFRHGLLRTRPHPASFHGETGTHRLDVAGGEAWIFAPEAPGPKPLVVVLHGAGGRAKDMLRVVEPTARERGEVVLAVQSQAPTWDLIHDGYGIDVARIDAALSLVFERYEIDPARIAIAGFSDGASYALSLGLANGELFNHVIAFSPGFMAPGAYQGKPRVFVSHGVHDEVLPIDPCGRTVVAKMKRRGYDVLFREFDGPHTVPQPIVREAAAWLAGG
jgi:predicted esterase